MLEIRYQSLLVQFDNSSDKILQKIDSLERNIHERNLGTRIHLSRLQDEIKLENIGTIYNEFNKTDWFPSEWDDERLNKNPSVELESLLSFLKICSNSFYVILMTKKE